MPRCAHAQARYKVVCFVCLSLCLSVCLCKLLQLHNEVQVRVSIVLDFNFLDFNSWICFVLELWLDLLTWNAIVAFSEQCEAKLVHVVLLLYLEVNSALEC